MSSQVIVRITEGPLAPNEMLAAPIGCGAQVVFEGVVRPEEGDSVITALDYEAYEPMTTRELTLLAEQMITKHKVSTICVEHSVGLVPVGKISFRLSICSKHRKECLQATDEFIDEMKRTVPLWKKVVGPHR